MITCTRYRIVEDLEDASPMEFDLVLQELFGVETGSVPSPGQGQSFLLSSPGRAGVDKG